MTLEQIAQSQHIDDLAEAHQATDSVEIKRAIEARMDAINAEIAEHHRDVGHIAEYEWTIGKTKQAHTGRGYTVREEGKE